MNRATEIARRLQIAADAIPITIAKARLPVYLHRMPEPNEQPTKPRRPFRTALLITLGILTAVVIIDALWIGALLTISYLGTR